MAAPLWIFVYFRAAPERRAIVAEALGRLRTQMISAFAVSIDIGLRDEEAVAWHTWLECHWLTHGEQREVYLQTLADTASECGLDALALTGRHVEGFRPETTPVQP